MAASLAIVLPIFGLIAIGYGARLFGLLGDRAGEGLSEFVFTLALPCLIFRTLVRADLPSTDPLAYWAAYFIGVAVVWAAAGALARRFFGLAGVSAVVAGFAAGQSNTILVGVPMILKAYGEAGAVPLFLLLAIHLPITMTAATLLVEGRQAALGAIASKLLRHPIIIGIAAGAAGRLVAPAIPEPAWRIVDLLAAAAVPCALVSMGVALRRYGLGPNWRLPALISALKLVVHPAIVFVLGTQVFALPPVWAGVAVLFAACPSGINAYIFAERYREGVPIASGAVALSTIMALATTAGWLALLGAG